MEDEHDDTDLEVGMNLPGLLSVGELRGLLSDVVSFEIEEDDAAPVGQYSTLSKYSKPGLSSWRARLATPIVNFMYDNKYALKLVSSVFPFLFFFFWYTNQKKI